jgi:methyltransferase family protein
MVVITIILLIAIITLALFVAIFFLIPFLFGAPYDITRKNSLKNIVTLTNPKKEDKIAELGSGDGRVCIELAKKNKNAMIHGFEINPILVWISRKKIRKLNLQDRIKIYWKSFWKIDFKDYNKVVLFQFRSIMKRMEDKIEKELKPKSQIISHNWELPTMKLKKKLGKKKAFSGEVYLYEK